MKKHDYSFLTFAFLYLVNVGLIFFFAYQTLLSSNDSLGIILAILLKINIGAGLTSIYLLLESILNELKKGNS